MLHLKEFVLTPVILAPGACRPQGPTRLPCAVSGCVYALAAEFQEATIEAPLSQIRRICSENGSRNTSRGTCRPQGPARLLCCTQEEAPPPLDA